MKNEPIVRTIQEYIPYKLKPLSFWECVSVDQKKKKKKWKNSFTNPYLHTQSLAIMIPVISD